MKKCIKSLAVFLSTFLLAASAFMPAPAAASDEEVTKTIPLLDFSDFEDGYILSKDSPNDLPVNMKWHSSDDYGGKREVVGLEDGSKGLKLWFNEQTASNDDRTISKVQNYAFTLSVPAPYRRYIDSVVMEWDNCSVASDGSWGNNNLNYLLSFTDGTNYAKDSDKTIRVNNLGKDTITKNIADMGKVSEWQFLDYYGNYNSVKWTEEDKSGISDIVLAVTVPYAADITSAYLLIESIGIVVKGTAGELEKADADYDELLEKSAVIADFENGTLTNVKHSAVLIDSEATEGVFAAQGRYMISHTRPGSMYNGNFNLQLNSEIRRYDGVSFYVYNPGNVSATLRCWIKSDGTPIAQKLFTVSPVGDYIKYTIWFDDVGTYNPNNQWYHSESNGYSISDIKNTVTEIDFRLPQAAEGSVFYFDDFRYEKYNNEFDREASLSLENTETVLDNGYEDDEQPVVTDDGITYSLDGSRNGPLTGNARWQGYKTVFPLSPEQMLNADGIMLTAENNSSVQATLGVMLRGDTDNNGEDNVWRWNEDPNSVVVKPGETVTKALNYRSNLYNNSDYGVHNWYKPAPSYPSAEENSRIRQLEIYVWVPEGASAGDTLEILNVKLLYGGNIVSADSSVTNGGIIIQDSGMVFPDETAVFTVAPDAGYRLVPGTLKVTDDSGNEIPVARDGFRETNSGSTYTFAMPASDVSVYAEFSDDLMTVYSQISAIPLRNAVKFDYTVPLYNGDINIYGEKYKAVTYGALVTSAEVIDKYDMWDSYTIEGIESAGASLYVDNVVINESKGFVYDRSNQSFEYNVIIDEIAPERQNTEFAVCAYVEYELSGGGTEYFYDDIQFAVYSDIEFESYNKAPSLKCGINISGDFDNLKKSIEELPGSTSLSESTYSSAASAGFDHVRLPLKLAYVTDESGILDETFMSYVDDAVIMALNNGLTVVLDFHSFNELMEDVNGNSDIFYSIWEQMAERYKNYPDSVIFELINEPTPAGEGPDLMSSEKLNELQNTAVAKIRAIDSDRIIALTACPYGGTYAADSIVLPEDTSNLIVSLHNYGAMSFTHQGMGYPVGADFQISGSPAEIEAGIRDASDFSAAHGNIPVWISEFGVYMGGLNSSPDDGFDESDVTEYLDYFTSLCNESGVGWCVWEYNVGFGIFDADDNMKNFAAAGLNFR